MLVEIVQNLAFVCLDYCLVVFVPVVEVAVYGMLNLVVELEDNYFLLFDFEFENLISYFTDMHKKKKLLHYFEDADKMG